MWFKNLLKKLKITNFQTFSCDFLIVSFLALTISHARHILEKFEKEFPFLSWVFSGGLEIGTAYAAFIVGDAKLKKETRAFAGTLLALLVITNYCLNCAFYFDAGAGDWAYALAAIFPVSITLLSAIRAGLTIEKETISRVAESLPVTTESVPELPETPSEQLPALPADRQKLARYMFTAGKSKEEISAHFGVTSKTVGNWLKASERLPENISEFPKKEEIAQ